MDDSWGNILYYVIVALFVIVGALKKKKPAAVLPPDDGEIHQRSEPETQGGFETLFETLLGNEIPRPYVQPVEDTIPEPKETMMEEYTRLQKLKEEVHEEKKEPVFADLKSIYSDTDVQNELEEDQEEEIDWRKAIIHKEILDRRYT
ncbi:hypothetical protein QUH73_04855 [Labilibaculum sp. K2S]|uniref:hypothetical protein n=1 Tax=Labilibaculum sp. K2S TaxID=3056386 RepID=UPI0025A42FDB|nr:hypothetical protein [Labilibaculum sp. K2S]MDM8159145.1 hypothetical protein [Labilibaculum sp. K2S]